MFYPRPFDDNGARAIFPIYTFSDLNHLYNKKQLSLISSEGSVNHLIMCDFILDVSMRISSSFLVIPARPSVFYMQAFSLLSNAYIQTRSERFVDDRSLTDGILSHSRDLMAQERLLRLAVQFNDLRNLDWVIEKILPLCAYPSVLSTAFQTQMNESIRGHDLDSFIFLNRLLQNLNKEMLKTAQPPLILPQSQEIPFNIVKFIGYSNPVNYFNDWVNTATSFGFKEGKSADDYSLSLLKSLNYHLSSSNGEEFLDILINKLDIDLLANVLQYKSWGLNLKMDWEKINIYVIKNFNELLAKHNSSSFIEKYGVNLFTFSTIYQCLYYCDDYMKHIGFPIIKKLYDSGERLILPELLPASQAFELINAVSVYGVSPSEQGPLKLKEYFYNELYEECDNEFYSIVINNLEKLDLEKNIDSNESSILKLNSFKI